jgi:hypothetical protein
VKAARGFLLLEVILSLLLVTGGLITIALSFSVSKKTLYQSRRLFLSGLLLRDQMFEFEEKGWIEDVSHTGSLPENGMAWNLRSTPVPRTDLKRVEMEIYDSGKPGTGYSIQTYLMKKKE